MNWRWRPHHKVGYLYQHVEVTTASGSNDSTTASSSNDNESTTESGSNESVINTTIGEFHLTVSSYLGRS